jgi:uncharacterized protein (TIRG00374 family)
VAADHETEVSRVAAINAAIDETRATGQVSTPSRRKLIWRIVMLVITAFSLYLLFPAIISVLGSWQDLETVNPLWFPLIIATQTASLVCFWNLQRIALRTKAWFSVATSQLASGALTRIVPGGQAAGAAMQFRMLTVAGINAATAGTSITALSLLTTGTVFVLPVLVLPAILSGTRVPSGLAQAAWIGAGGFVLLAIGAGCLLIFDRPLEIIGSVIQRLRNRIQRKEAPVTDLPDRLVKERDLIRSALGTHLGAAILSATGRSLFDFLTLLAALTAVGAHPDPSLVLLAYAGAQILGMIPITPGGLGFVEAGLTATLALAGVGAGEAVLATLIYRLASYWLPMLAGLVAYLLFRRRYQPGSVVRPAPAT